MKKTLIAVAAAAALTTSAFAEITFGAWLRVLTAPVASDGKDTVAVMSNTWGGNARVARLNVHAKSEDEKMGFEMCVGAPTGNSGLENVADTYIWAKPVDAVKVYYGNYDYPLLRGDVCLTTTWNYFRPSKVFQVYEDEGLLMTGLNNAGENTGVLIEATPVDGLFIYGHAPITSTAKKAEDVYKNIRAGFAYDIEGVGRIKAQLILKGTSKVKDEDAVVAGWYDKDNNKVAFDDEKYGNGDISFKKAVDAKDATLDKVIEAAFDLTAVDNLYVGVGFQMTMIDKMEDRGAQAKDKMRITAGATYQVNDELKVTANAGIKTFQKGKSDNGQDARFQFGAGVDYNLGDGISAAADVRYVGKQGVENNDKTDCLAFGVCLEKHFSNGYIGAAFEAQTNSGDWSTYKCNADSADKLTWCVPVAFGLSF